MLFATILTLVVTTHIKLIKKQLFFEFYSTYTLKFIQLLYCVVLTTIIIITVVVITTLVILFYIIIVVINIYGAVVTTSVI